GQMEQAKEMLDFALSRKQIMTTARPMVREAQALIEGEAVEPRKNAELFKPVDGKAAYEPARPPSDSPPGKTQSDATMATQTTAVQEDRNLEAIKLLQGTWVMASLETGGKKASKELVETDRLVIEGNRFSWKRGGNAPWNATLRLNPAEGPNAID